MPAASARNKRSAGRAGPTGVVAALRFYGLLALAAFALRAFVFAPFSIPTASMLPTLLVGDYLIVTKWNYGYSRHSLPFGLPLIPGRVLARTPERGDVVVFKYPGADKVDYVKRVIGLPGERIRVQGGVPFIDGREVGRDRIADWRMPVSPNSPCRAQGEDVRDLGTACVYPRYRETLPGGRTIEVLDSGVGRLDTTREFTVPAGHLFMLGDNRDDSLDSRLPVDELGVGFVPMDHLVGRAGIAFFSTDGSAELLKPWTWFAAMRPERIGGTY